MKRTVYGTVAKRLTIPYTVLVGTGSIIVTNFVHID